MLVVVVAVCQVKAGVGRMQRRVYTERVRVRIQRSFGRGPEVWTKQVRGEQYEPVTIVAIVVPVVVASGVESVHPVAVIVRPVPVISRLVPAVAA